MMTSEKKRVLELHPQIAAFERLQRNIARSNGGLRPLRDSERSAYKCRRVWTMISIWEFLRVAHRWAKISDIARMLEINERTARRYCSDLEAAGFVEIDRTNMNWDGGHMVRRKQ